MFFGACATEQTVTKTQVKKDWRGETLPFTVGKDKDGNPVMKSDRRSSFEGRSSNIAGDQSYSKKDYNTKSYRKKSWFGSKIFGKKEYQGNTDANRFKSEPWFVSKQANASGKRARADGKSFGVNPFRTKSATEQTGRSIARTSDAETDVRRRVFMQPDITHWKKQKGLSVSDTNRMLGR
ncbi:MAG: hypothetical protein AB8F34_02890 [Akkermansiaceae bacterium]